MGTTDRPETHGGKTLYLVGGTMGVGKTTVCRILNASLPDSVMLDGDWCWYMHPFQVTPETKAMAEDNIRHLLGNFLRCTAYRNVIFCWVMHEQAIIDSLLAALPLTGVRVIAVSLVCSEAALRERLTRDVEAGLRTDDVIGRSLARLPLYAALDTRRLDVSAMTPGEAAAAIAAMK